MKIGKLSILFIFITHLRTNHNGDQNGSAVMCDNDNVKMTNNQSLAPYGWNFG
jgi:hypothetical protein